LVLVSSQFSIWAAVGSLPVLVHDYAGVAPNVLARAEVEASRVLATAAVDVQWINCTDSSTDPEPCRRLPDATALVVQILPAQASTHGVEPDALGFAAPPDPSVSGRYAGVFFGRVASRANGQLRTEVLLGHVIAHELGHLLLGLGGHARSGIMAGTWDARTLHQAARGQLVFDQLQRSRIEKNVVQRSWAALRQ